LKAALIVQGVKMIYVPIMPGHARRLNEPWVCSQLQLCSVQCHL